jgi:hypothetical protein
LEFLDRNGFFAGRMIVGTQGSEEAINGVEKNPTHSGTAVRIPLDGAKVIVNVDVELGQDASRSAKIT